MFSGTGWTSGRTHSKKQRWGFRQIGFGVERMGGSACHREIGSLRGDVKAVGRPDTRHSLIRSSRELYWLASQHSSFICSDYRSDICTNLQDREEVKKEETERKIKQKLKDRRKKEKKKKKSKQNDC